MLNILNLPFWDKLFNGVLSEQLLLTISLEIAKRKFKERAHKICKSKLFHGSDWFKNNQLLIIRNSNLESNLEILPSREEHFH